MLKDKFFVFTLENKVTPSEPNNNKNENFDFSFYNFSSHFDEHINYSISWNYDLRRFVVSIFKYFIEVKNNELTNSLKRVRCVCKKLCFTAGMFKCVMKWARYVR